MSSTLEDLKKTALCETHKGLKARMVSFGGWLMPIQYEGVIAEHQKVRNQCGIFDVSHMGEVRVKGKDAVHFLQYATVNDVAKLGIGEGQYSALLNHEGGMIDDLILYRLGEADFLLCVNASNTEKDVKWLQDLLASTKDRYQQIELKNESDQWSQIAVQGPISHDAIKTILQDKDAIALDQLGYMKILAVSLFNKEAWIARTGYTGEHGYEIYLPNAIAEKTWNQLLEHPAVSPVGLGARDTLRLESCYLLYGNDMNETVSPIEAGIGWAVKAQKGPFVGQELVLRHLDESNKERRKMVAFVMTEKAIARQGMEIYKNGEKIGVVTSGSFLPTLEHSGGMALVEKTSVKLDEPVEIDVRGKRKLAKIVKRPLYSPKVK